MEATVTNTATEEKVWSGGNQPLGASYGKMMMWFFILSDSLNILWILAAYGFSRFKFIEIWPIADEVFYPYTFLSWFTSADDLCCVYDICVNCFFCYYGVGG